jgi:hypothetical protein
MSRTFFSKSEAQEWVGCHVKAGDGLEAVRPGATGTVVRAKKSGTDGWLVRVEWNVPKKRSEYMAFFGEFSFNLPGRKKAVTSDFSKDEFERFLEPQLN